MNNPYQAHDTGYPTAKIVKSVFTKTGTYNDMTLRPYQSTLTNHGQINAFAEMTVGGTNFNPSNIGSLAMNFVAPSTQATGHVMIENGWETERYRFMFMVDVMDTMSGIEYRKVVQGYTDYCGTGNNTVDPNMKLYFNNILTLKTTKVGNPETGYVDRVIIGSSDHILRGDFDSTQVYNSQGQFTQTMTPSDVFDTMANGYLLDRFQSDGNEVYNPSSYFSVSPIKKSRRSNNNPSRYLSDILTKYTECVATDIDNSNSIIDPTQTFGDASGASREGTVHADPLLNLFTNNSHHFLRDGYITYGEVAASIDGFDHLTHFVMTPEVFKTNTGSVLENHVKGQTEHWLGTNLDTLWATALSNSVPTLMMDSMLTAVGFYATNKNVMNNEFSHAGRTGISITHVRSFVEGYDVSSYINQFKQRLVSEILNGLSKDDQIDYEMTVFVNFVGETRISLQIQDQPYIEFATPTFADGSFSPVVTNQSQLLDNMANNFQTLVGELNQTVPQDNLNYGAQANWNNSWNY